jgi:hypothetical protein
MISLGRRAARKVAPSCIPAIMMPLASALGEAKVGPLVALTIEAFGEALRFAARRLG